MWVPDIGELLFSCSRPSYSPPNQRCRWFVVYGGYAAFDTSPPAIIVVAKSDFPIVAHQIGMSRQNEWRWISLPLRSNPHSESVRDSDTSNQTPHWLPSKQRLDLVL